MYYRTWRNGAARLGLVMALLIGGAMTAEAAPPGAKPPTLTEKEELARQIQLLDKLSQTLRADVAKVEKQIQLLAGAVNGQAGGNSVRVGLLQQRYATIDSEYKTVLRDMAKLEAKLADVKKLPKDKNPKIAVELETRLATLKVSIQIKQFEASQLQFERETIRGMIIECSTPGINLEKAMNTLQPQREMIAKSSAIIAELQAQYDYAYSR